MGEHFRMLFLFKDKSRSDFISKFSDREHEMLESLKHLEGAADKLDRVNKVAKSFSVLSSLVGTVGGLLSIIGLSLIPATEGEFLTKLGACLGISSIVIIVLTFIIQFCFNCNQKKSTRKHLKSFMADMKGLQHCMEEKTSCPSAQLQKHEIDGVVGVDKVLTKVQALIKFIDLIADIVGASDTPEICQKAVKGFFARLSLIVPNVLSFFTDAFNFCKQVYSLAKCYKTEVSKFIRARAALWSSEMNSWKKIHESLCEGQRISEKHRAVLDKLFIQGGQ